MSFVDVVKLSDVATFVRGITFKPDDVVTLGEHGSVACMRTKNVQSELVLSDVWAVNERLVKRSEQYLQSGDTLVSSANSWNLVGKCCLVPDLEFRSSFGGFVSVLRAKSDDVDPEYLYRWFSSDLVQAQARSFGRQTTNISNLDMKRCLQMDFPLPSLADQRKVVEVMARVDAMRSKRIEVLGLLDELAVSIFNDLFSDRLHALSPDNFSPLSEVAVISSGITKGRKVRDGQGGLRRVPYLTVANVQDKRLNLSNVKEIMATDSEIAKFQIRDGDLLLTEGGDPDKLGRGVLWNGEISECIHQNHIFRVRVKEGSLLSPVYLSWLVSSRWGKSYFLRRAKQTTGIASINKGQLGKFPVLVPGISEQKKFSGLVDQVGVMVKKNESHLAYLDELFASVQQRAFRGDLWEDSAA